MNIVVRKADVKDVPIISYLGRLTFSETFGDLFRDPQDLEDYLLRTFSVEKLQSSFQNSNNAFWLAFADEVPVGFGKLKLDQIEDEISQKRSSQLQKIYVLKDYLSMKIGLKTQEEMIKTAKDFGSELIWLSVLRENERAINFYLKNGFSKTGNHDFRIGKELFHFNIMTKDL